MRKRKAETLMEFLIAMAVAGMLFIMISTALQRSTSSVSRIYNQDILSSAIDMYIAGLPTDNKDNLNTYMTNFTNEKDLDRIAEFTRTELQKDSHLKLWSFDIKAESHDETYTVRNVLHFFN